MHSTESPRGLVARSVMAAAVFAAAVLPGWMLADLLDEWTGIALLGYLLTMAYQAAAVAVLAPYASYRRRDWVLGLVPLIGSYVCCVLAWRVALLPYRDWPPRRDEESRARWLDDPRFAGTWYLPTVQPRRARALTSPSGGDW